MTPKNSRLLARLFVALEFGGKTCRVFSNGASYSQLHFALINMSISCTRLRKAVQTEVHVANRLGSDRERDHHSPMRTRLDEQDSQRYTRETTRPPDATGEVPHPPPLTVDDRAGDGGDSEMDLPLENVRQWRATQTNLRRVQLERLLRSGVTSVNRQDGCKQRAPTFARRLHRNEDAYPVQPYQVPE